METGLVFLAGWAVGVVWSKAWSHVFSTSDHRPAARMVQVGVTVPAALPSSDADVAQWDLYIVQFAMAGHRWGFSLRQMQTCTTITRPGWSQYISLLRRANVLAVTERSETWWTGKWDYWVFRSAIKRGYLAIPYPARRPPNFQIR